MRELGIDRGAARRLRSVVERPGYPLPPEPPGARRYRHLATGLLRLDYLPQQNHVLMARFDFRSRVAGGVGEHPFALSGSGAEIRDRSTGALAQLTSFLAGARNELRVSGWESSQTRSPYLTAPSGEVLVASPRNDGEGGSSLLRFGPGTLGQGRSTASLREVSDDFSLSLGARHRVKLGFLANRESATRSGAANPFGTFSFSSLADFEAGRPRAFARTLGESTSGAVADYLAAFAGHLWRPRDQLRLIYGLRLEGRRYARASVGGSNPTPIFGLLPGSVPAEWGVSPRLGFSFSPRDATWDVRGGVGEFRGKLPVASLAGTIGEDGTPKTTQLLCLGTAAPRPDWDRFLADLDEVPTACADGQAHLASNIPRATLFEHGLEAPRTWRAQLGWNWSGSLPIGNVGLGVEGRWTHGLSQPLARDRNFTASAGFALPDEAGRAVHVPASSIDPATGSIGLATSRIDPALGTVRLVDGAGRSTVADLTVRSYLWTGTQGLLILNYTYTRAHDEVGSMAAPWQFSMPLSARTPGDVVRGVSDLERRHGVQALYTRPLYRWPGEIGMTVDLTSGLPYTPQVDRDVNGDGLANEPAFVFDPAVVRDPALRNGMESLLAGPPDVRNCLRAQLRQVAGRNSCRGTWTADVDLLA
ncbi:MAG TPA: TonB-dependent receptor, partial [Longimicrobiaceae bacterium]|nr:TonB-dependent receptor [Longimicrobiaceae bacterium]